MRHRALLLIPWLIFAGSCARARLPEVSIRPGQGQEPLTWRRAVELALARNPTLASARADVRQSRYFRNAAFGRYLPEVDASLSRFRDYTDEVSYSFSHGVSVSQPIFEGGEITGDALQAWHGWQSEKWEYQDTSATVREQLRTAYVELLRLNKLLAVNRAIAARRQENADLLKLRYEAGRENEGAWRRAQAIAEEAAFSVRQTERAIESQSLALGRHLGGYYVVPIPLGEDLEAMIPASVDLPGDYVTLAEATPLMQSTMRTTDSFKAAILSQQAQLWPRVTGQWDYSSSGDHPSAGLDDSTSIGFRISMPLFAGGQNVNNVLATNAQYQSQLAFARATRDLIIETLSESWAAFKNDWEDVAVRRSFLEAGRIRSEIMRTQYTNGLISFEDFDRAEEELVTAERNYVQSLADVLTSEAAWIADQGGTLEQVADVR